ncbi:oligosaccharide flippase family protein, partial [Rodentibacter pneumotropicus]|uniref:oligosaccharide flippase family protein n=1 Tax=Rodentibacter pneumotropicus TaxID=758 RepID=UPI0015C3A000
MSGTIGAQLLGLVLTPVLTRLFSASEFGIAASFQAVLAVICIISNLRYELSLPLAKTDSDAKNLFIFNIGLLIIFTCLMFLVIQIAGDNLANLFKLDILIPYLWFMPLAIFVLGIYRVFSYWAIRYKMYKDLAQTKITQVFMMLVCQIAGYKSGELSLIIGQTLGQGIGGVRIGLHAIKQIEKAQLSLSRILELVKEFKRFPLYDTPAALLNTLSSQLPFLLLIGVFSPTLTGAYALAYRILSLPVTLVGQSVSGAFYGEVRELVSSGRLAIVNQRLVQRLTLLALPPGICCMLLAPDLFSFVFGESWRLAGQIAVYSIVWIFVQFIYAPLSGTFLALNKQNLNLIVQIVLFTLRLLSLLVGITFFDEMTTIFLFCITSA